MSRLCDDGTLFLALPQVPLTLGNAVIAITEENNRLFPTRPVSDAKIATSTGLMNVLSAAVGGVPMCHGLAGWPVTCSSARERVVPL
jgi:hypothetical protein